MLESGKTCHIHDFMSTSRKGIKIKLKNKIRMDKIKWEERINSWKRNEGDVHCTSGLERPRDVVGSTPPSNT
jgi:hypothetical protein